MLHLLKSNGQDAETHRLEQFVRSHSRNLLGGTGLQDQVARRVARGMVLSCQALRSAQARETVTDGKAYKDDPDAEFELRADIKVVVLEALRSRRLTHETHTQILEQIFSPEGFKPSLGQDYLSQLRTQQPPPVFSQAQGPELADDLFAIFQCLEQLSDLQTQKGKERIAKKHISDEDVDRLGQGQHRERVKGLQNRAKDGPTRFVCTNWIKIFKKLCSFKEAFYVAESLRVNGGIPELTFEKGILANLIKGDNPEFWSNPFRDRVGKGGRDDFGVPPEEPMDAKQRRFEDLKIYDGESLQSQKLKAHERGNQVRYIAEVAADGTSLVVSNQWAAPYMKEKSSEGKRVRLSNVSEVAKCIWSLKSMMQQPVPILESKKRFQNAKLLEDASVNGKLMRTPKQVLEVNCCIRIRSG